MLYHGIPCYTMRCYALSYLVMSCRTYWLHHALVFVGCIKSRLLGNTYLPACLSICLSDNLKMLIWISPVQCLCTPDPGNPLWDRGAVVQGYRNRSALAHTHKAPGPHAGSEPENGHASALTPVFGNISAENPRHSGEYQGWSGTLPRHYFLQSYHRSCFWL